MDLTTFIITVFCLIDDELAGQRLRRRGPQPKLRDSEVLTMEVVGEYLGLDQDVALLAYFRRHWLPFFPGLRSVHRTTFVRQAANLWAVKQQLWQRISVGLAHDELLSVVDSLPIPVCRFGRAPYCRRFAGLASYGHDEGGRQVFYGFRLHARIAWPGVLRNVALAPANEHDSLHAAELLQDAAGVALGDRNYWDPLLRQDLFQHGLFLLTPFRIRRTEPFAYPRWLTQKRYRIETVFAQLTERYQLKKVWTKDLWHFTARFFRKLLSHTLACLCCQTVGLPPLHLSQLLSD